MLLADILLLVVLDRYLHSHNPPIVHHDLSSNNILLTTFLRAKIGDLGVAKVLRPDHRKSLTKTPGTADFMPPEIISDNITLQYGTALDVFSFGAVMLHVATQEWPTPLAVKMYDKDKRKPIALTEVERRQPHLDKITGAIADIKPLIISCLNDDPSVRPNIIDLSESIKRIERKYPSSSLLDQATEQVFCPLQVYNSLKIVVKIILLKVFQLTIRKFFYVCPRSIV